MKNPSTNQLILELHVKPRGKKDCFVGKYGERIKVEITAPPTDEKANSHLIKFLAKYFGVTQSQVQILRGQHSRDKTVCIENPQQTPEFSN